MEMKNIQELDLFPFMYMNKLNIPYQAMFRVWV